jgi:ABC-2 type transport system permease protein
VRASGRWALVALVAEREVRERARSRTFRISTAVTVVLVAGIVALSGRSDEGPRPLPVGIVGAVSPPLRTAVEAAVTAAGYRPLLTTPDGEAATRAAVVSGDVALAVVGSGGGERILVKTLPARGDTSRHTLAVAAVTEAVRTQAGFERAGLAPEQAAALINSPPPPVEAVAPAPPPTSAEERGPAGIGILVLFFMLSQYGYWILGGVVEEKSSRVIEVLVAAVPAGQLLAGKVAGIGVLAIGHAALMAGSALLAARASGAGSLPSGSAEAIVMTVVWFAIGYALYCTVFAAMGSLISRSEEIQNVSFPVQVPLLVGYFIATVALSDGNPTTVLRIFAFVPLTAPMCMPVLRAIGAAPLWQVALSMALTIAATVATARVASGIYRRAILRTGRRLRLREVLRSA